VNFKGYKKVHEDKDFTTLRHYEGHEIRIAHNKLPKHQKEALKQLPNKGPHVSKADKAAPGEAKDAQKLSQAQTADRAGGKHASVASAGPMMAQGGEVDAPEMGKRRQAPAPTPTPTPQPSKAPVGKIIGFPGFAQGGQVPDGGQTLGDKIGYPKAYAEGGDVDLPGAQNADGSYAPAVAAPQGSIPVGTGMIPESLANHNPGSGRPQSGGPIEQTPPGAMPPDTYGIDPEQYAQMQQQAAPQTHAQTPQDGQGGDFGPDHALDPSKSPLGGQSAPNDPYGVEAYNSAFSRGVSEQKRGLNQEAAAQEQMGQMQQKVLQQHVLDQQDRQAAYQSHYDALDQERKNFMDDIAKQKFDPMRVWHQKDVPGKISTALGLIIGGLSFNGTNGAMDFFNKQIDRDIQAQHMEMEKKNTLLGANLKMFGNLRDATDMTRLMSLDTISSQLKMMAAKAQGPIARARALQAAGEIDQKAAPIMSQIAMRRTLVGGANAGAIDPSTIVRMIVPEHQQPEAYKQLKEAKDTTTFRDNLFGTFDKLVEVNTMGNRVGSPIQSRKQVNALIEPLTAAMSKNTAGRYTEQDAGALKALWPQPGDDANTIAIKRAQLQKMAEEKMHFPMLDSFGIKIPGTGRYALNGEKRIKLAPPVR
jgi:hypothetical protein